LLSSRSSCGRVRQRTNCGAITHAMSTITTICPDVSELSALSNRCPPLFAICKSTCLTLSEYRMATERPVSELHSLLMQNKRFTVMYRADPTSMSFSVLSSQCHLGRFRRPLDLYQRFSLRDSWTRLHQTLRGHRAIIPT